MGIRFRKSKEILPGVKVNLGKKSVGVSVGGKLGGVSVNSRGDVTKRVSAPGTGISIVDRERAQKKARFCGSCGARLRDGANFCPECGAPSAR